MAIADEPQQYVALAGGASFGVLLSSRTGAAWRKTRAGRSSAPSGPD